MSTSANPLVSIVCLTYNEEQFVRDTFNNFLSQQTNFSFEVLVYDDASQDSTPQIIQEYVERYPHIFRATLYSENNFKKGLGFLGLRIGFQEARGKYIAYCEGDDYWCDNSKLQKQVDFLESHPQFEVCAHESLIRNDYDEREDGILFSHTKVNLFIDRTKRQHYTFEDTLTGNIFHISSMMFRNRPIDWPQWINQVTALDMVLFMILAERGDIYRLSEVMSVYRHNKHSITSSQSQFGNQVLFNNLSIDLLLKMDVYWLNRYSKQIYKIIAQYYADSAWLYTKKSMRDLSQSKLMMKLALKYNKNMALMYITKKMINRFSLIFKKK